jgi:hypothetical protein
MRRRIATGNVGLLIALAACESSPVAPSLTPALTHADAAAAAAPTPTQAPADAISANIQRLHLVRGFPFPTIVDPRFGSGNPRSRGYSRVVAYAHAGDAAIWTGHYLAAEATRYEVTKSPNALANAQRALDGIQGLVDVTADAMPRNRGLLARFLWPDSWWYADRMAVDEGGHGVYRGRPGGVRHRWLGNTTRDQYSGVFFGLAAAYDAFERIDDRTLRRRSQQQVRALVTQMLDFLLRNGWNVPMPDGRHSTTFLQRPDQQLTLLQVGRHVNPTRFELLYQAHRAAHAATIVLPIEAECRDTHGSYFKFNLNHINLHTLIRLEETGVGRIAYLNAFESLRRCTGGRAGPEPDHENAHFNTIDHALLGANVTRDRETREYLGLWLQRPRRDYYVDLRGRYRACGQDRACTVIPVNERVNTDFLWQRSPYLLYPDRRGNGTIETAAIDYLLPYWMARRHGVITQ